jgi:hypothetical protein
MGAITGHGVESKLELHPRVINSLMRDLSGIIYDMDLLFSSAALRLELRTLGKVVLDCGGICGIASFTESLQWFPTRKR